jgi:hypothetical protein
MNTNHQNNNYSSVYYNSQTHFYGENNGKFTLPYSDDGVEKLKNGVAAFIINLGVLF